MKSRLIIIILVITAFWFGISWRWYTCGIKGFCGEENKYAAYHQHLEAEKKEAEAREARFKALGPIVFKYGNAVPEINENRIGSFLDSLLGSGAEGSRLNISGLRMKGENRDLALQRAQEVRGIIGDKLADDQVSLSATQIVGNTLREDSMFSGVSYVWEKILEGTEGEKALRKIRVYFPFNSANAELDNNIKEALGEILAELKESGKSVQIVGHTDNVGDPDRNMQLGLARAQMIESYFQSQGLDANQMNSESRGLEEPIANNATEMGRAQNRRVELVFE